MSNHGAILIVGASGATGRWVVRKLLDRGRSVRAIVRSPATFTEALGTHPRLTAIHAAVLDLTDAELAQHVAGCQAVVSCLGHNLDLKGIYGKPRRLVTEATRRLCEAIRFNTPATPVKFVLMNSAGCRNERLAEKVSLAERLVLGLLRLLVPPHADNEQAVGYLIEQVGTGNGFVEWVAVRPDSLIDADIVTAYGTHPSPTRSALFNAGRTSRINVTHFMADLITDDAVWKAWKGQTPVIYDAD